MFAHIENLFLSVCLCASRLQCEGPLGCNRCYRGNLAMEYICIRPYFSTSSPEDCISKNHGETGGSEMKKHEFTVNRVLDSEKIECVCATLTSRKISVIS